MFDSFNAKIYIFPEWKADARLTRVFRTIIQYMHEVSQKTGKNKDPNVQKIMKMLNDNHSLMEKHTGVSRKTADDSEDKKDISDLDLDMKETELPQTSQEIAEEKRIKRLEKQKRNVLRVNLDAVRIIKSVNIEKTTNLKTLMKQRL
jgi:hypothetical protein